MSRASAHGTYPLHELMKHAKLDGSDLECVLSKYPAAAVAGDKDGTTAFHMLMRSQRPRKEREKLIVAYLKSAPAAASKVDCQGRTAVEELFSSSELSSRDLTPFVQQASNPLLACSSIALALIRTARGDAKRRTRYLRVSEELLDVGSRIIRRLPSLSIREEINGSKEYIFGGENPVSAEALLLPEELLPPLPSMHIRGPLALAVQYEGARRVGCRSCCHTSRPLPLPRLCVRAPAAHSQAWPRLPSQQTATSAPRRCCARTVRPILWAKAPSRRTLRVTSASPSRFAASSCPRRASCTERTTT